MEIEYRRSEEKGAVLKKEFRESLLSKNKGTVWRKMDLWREQSKCKGPEAAMQWHI